MAAALIAALLAAQAPPPVRELPDLVRARQIVAAPDASAEACAQQASRLVDLLYDPGTLAAVPVEELLDALALAGRPLCARAGDDVALLFEFELASAALAAGALDRAGDGLATALTRWPADAGLLALAAERAMAARAWDAARAHLERARAALAAGPGAGDPLVAGLVELEALLYELRLGRADRALLRLEALLAQPGLPPPLAAAAHRCRIDLFLMAERNEDAVAAAASVPPELVSPDLVAIGAIARAARAEAPLEDAATSDALEALAGAPGVSRPIAWVARLLAAEQRLERGDVASAAAALARLDDELAGAGGGTASHGRERAWLRALQSRVAAVGAAGLARDAFDALLEEWRATPLLPGGISFLRSGPRRLVVDRALAATGTDAEAAFTRLLETQALGSLARRLSLPTPTLAEVRSALLGDGESLLAWFPARGRTHLFVVDAGTVRRFEVAPGRAIDAAAARLALAAEGAQRQRLLRELAELLLVPQARESVARAAHVWLVGTELLGGAPVRELPCAGGVALGACVPAAELPSLPVALWLRARPRASWPATIDARVGPDESLSGERFELDRTVLRRGLPTLRFVDAGEELAACGDVLFLIAHGVVDRRRDRFAGLLLGRDARGEPRVCWADAFERASLPPLVVLAACSAGEAPVRVGEDGSEHLGGAALLGGARCVLLGRGRLDAATAMPLLAAFLRGVEQGERPAAALAAALREADGAAPFPGLHLLGLGDEPLRARSPASAAPGGGAAQAAASATRPALAGALGAIGAACVALWLRRRWRGRA